jgi:ADP-ribosylglycohydrolase
MMTDRQEEIIRGVFFGQAIGDALGLGSEFLNKQQIKEHYPEGLFSYSQIIQDNHRKRWQIGNWTDDTDQFLCIVDAILENGEISEYNFANELYKWFKGKPFGIGKTVLKVVTLPQFTLYPHKAAELVWKLSRYKNASNGAIMRTSILGLWQYWDNNLVIKNTESVCKVTHFDPRCIGSCVIITSIISNLLRTNELLSAEQLVEIGKKYDQQITDYIFLAEKGTIEQLCLDESTSIGYTLKALSGGLWAYFNAENFEDGLIKIVNQGGDADTNAAVACSLLGAKFGFGGIPKKYIDNLLNEKLLNEKIERFMKITRKNRISLLKC